jgi:hypothetical protein
VIRFVIPAIRVQDRNAMFNVSMEQQGLLRNVEQQTECQIQKLLQQLQAQHERLQRQQTQLQQCRPTRPQQRRVHAPLHNLHGTITGCDTPPSPKSRNIALPVYWINLDRATDRRLCMEKQFARRNITHHRVSAIDASVDAWWQAFIPEQPPQQYQGSVACELSHYKAMHSFLQSNAPVALILEDDLSFEFEGWWSENLIDTINGAPQGWETLQLGVITVSDGWSLLVDNGKQYQKRFTLYYSTMAYAVTRDYVLWLFAQRQIPTQEPVLKVQLPRLWWTTGNPEDHLLVCARSSYTLFPPLFTYPLDNESLVLKSTERDRFHMDSKERILKWYNEPTSILQKVSNDHIQ